MKIIELQIIKKQLLKTVISEEMNYVQNKKAKIVWNTTKEINEIYQSISK